MHGKCGVFLLLWFKKYIFVVCFFKCSFGVYADGKGDMYHRDSYSQDYDNMPPTPWWRYAITGYKSNGNTIYMAKVRSLNILTNIAFMVTIQANQPLYVHCSFMAAQHSINKPSDVIASQVIIAVNIGLYIHIQWYCVTYLKTDIEYKTRLYFHWMYLKSTKFNSSSVENRNLTGEFSQYHSCWWPGS